MFTFHKLFCVLFIVGTSFATIPNSMVNFKIFDNKTQMFESNVIDLVQSAREFFANSDIVQIIDTGTYVNDIGPFMKQLSSLTSSFQHMDRGDDGWRKTFENSIDSEHKWQIQYQSLETIDRDSTMKSIMDVGKYIRNPKSKFAGNKLHLLLNDKIDLFDKDDSLIKRSPLLGSAPLIELGLISSVISPLIKEAFNYEIAPLPCKMRDVLIDYRSRAVDARLDEISIELIKSQPASAHQLMRLYELLANIKSKPYNPLGYTNSSSLECEKDCKLIDPKQTSVCVTDNFGSDSYFSASQNDVLCIQSYAALVRQRVEELFPVQILNKQCHEAAQTPTGFGWLTVKIRKVHANMLTTGSACDLFSACDPYIKLFVNGTKEEETKIQDGINLFNANVIYLSKKIPKTTTIKIQVWDSDSFLYGGDDLIQETEGTIDSFLQQPIRYGAQKDGEQNAIETSVFWQDERSIAAPPLIRS